MTCSIQVPGTGILPSNAIIGGREADGRQIWVARAPYAVSIINYKASLLTHLVIPYLREASVSSLFSGVLIF